MKKSISITFALLFILCIVIIGNIFYVRHKNESTCINRQRYLHAGAESFCLEHGYGPDRIIKIEELANDYVPFGMELAACPSDGHPYAPFTVANGPVCPNEHDFAPGEKRPCRASEHSKLGNIYKYAGWTNLIDKDPNQSVHRPGVKRTVR